jgi:hypothetical protein
MPSSPGKFDKVIQLDHQLSYQHRTNERRIACCHRCIADQMWSLIVRVQAVVSCSVLPTGYFAQGIPIKNS